MNKTKPYFAVIFTSKLTDNTAGYAEMSEKMKSLAKRQSGFIGIDSARSEVGITVSYWDSLEAIRLWKQNTEHSLVQQMGKEKWYKWYNVKICKVEREYDFETK